MRYIIIIILSLIAGIVVGTCAGSNTKTETATDTLYIRDTVRQPVAHDSTIIRYITRKVLLSKTDTITQCDTLHTSDTVLVTLPVTQKIYRDTNYTAWVSGYEASLDSITVTHKTIERTQTMQTKDKSKWSIGIQAGVGVDKSFNPTLYLGVGLTYKLINF